MSTTIDIPALLLRYGAAVNAEMERFFMARYKNTAREEPERRFEEAMRYAVLSPGKRVRPILAMLAYEFTSKKGAADILPWIIGLEFLHAFTLVHDDLPSMDNDELRR